MTSVYYIIVWILVGLFLAFICCVSLPIPGGASVMARLFDRPRASRPEEHAAGRVRQKAISTEAALRRAGPWNRASILLPSGSSKKAA